MLTFNITQQGWASIQLGDINISLNVIIFRLYPHCAGIMYSSKATDARTSPSEPAKEPACDWALEGGAWRDTLPSLKLICFMLPIPAVRLLSLSSMLDGHEAQVTGCENTVDLPRHHCLQVYSHSSTTVSLPGEEKGPRSTPRPLTL